VAHITVQQVIPAPPQVVWDDIAHVDRHVEWMADARSITFLTDRHSGPGTRIEVLTAVGPLRTTDVMTFTEWSPPHRMAIRHEGLVTGVGAFTLHESGGGTRFVWEENLTFPWYLGGAVAAAAAAPVLRAVWRRNLSRLADRF
jgi:carbon monoxide dehydrogenase subunit G